MEDLFSNERALHDAKAIERCRACAEATHQFLTTERQVLERRILVLTNELGFLESHINVLELQRCRPPTRQVPLPETVKRMQTKTLSVLKAQHQLIKDNIQYYMHAQINMVNGGVLAAGQWQYAQDKGEHNDLVQKLR